VTVEPPRDVPMAIWRPMPRWCWPSLRAPTARWRRLLVAELEKLPGVSAEIAGPGFINLRLTAAAWLDELRGIARWARITGALPGAGTTVNVEYVSANPTGPMHMGHCRGAVVGDALASLLEYAGHKVIREYYVNDAGAQVQVLARSAHSVTARRWARMSARSPRGSIPATIWCRWAGAGAGIWRQICRCAESEWLAMFRVKAVAAMMDMIREDLALLGIKHDLFSSRPNFRRRASRKRPRPGCAQDLVYDGELEAPRASCPMIGSRWRCRCSAAPSLATIRTARSRSRMAAGPISARIWPITSRRRRPPTRWSTSGARITRARSSASRPPLPP
jgi:arginyl-tRNA synthetase